MKQRISTAIFGLIIVVPIILYGNWPFILLAYLLATIALFELMRMFFKEKFTMQFIFATLFLWLFMYPGQEFIYHSFTINKFDIAVLFTALLLVVMVLSKNNFTYDNVAFLLLSTVYLGTAFSYIIVTRFYGLHVFLFILFLIWATDSGAYFIGRKFGEKKLWPSISPNKTIGGAIGGVLFALIVAIIFQLIYPIEYSFISLMIIAVVISIFGQIGDLVASAIKRNYNVKDSGKIFPGHGGVMDRLDSIIFVLFILQLINYF